MRRRLHRLLWAVGGFLRGFTGAAELAREPGAATRELVHRCERRGHCC